MSSSPRKILIIRHGALGDIFQAFGPFGAIRSTFPEAHISLLTASPYASLARKTPWFNHVFIDDRPSWGNIHHIRYIQRILRDVDMVFDLQNSHRTTHYFRLAPPNLIWSGQHPKATLPHHNPHVRHMHTLMRQKDQLRAAGITLPPRTIPSFLIEEGPKLPSPYIVLVPGAAAHRPGKQWPASYFARLAHQIDQWGLCPVIVGDSTQNDIAHSICSQAPASKNLTGQTDIPALAGLLHRAALAIGNDTGPMHIAATMNCPTLTLFSHESDPRRCAPQALQANYSRTLSGQPLSTLSPARVISLLHEWGLPLIKERLSRLSS